MLLYNSTDAVRQRQILSQVGNAEIEAAIIEWLRTAKDRSGDRRQREAKRQSLIAQTDTTNLRDDFQLSSDDD